MNRWFHITKLKIKAKPNIFLKLLMIADIACRLDSGETVIGKEFKIAFPNFKKFSNSINEVDAEEVTSSTDWHVTAEAGHYWISNVTQPENVGRIISRR